MATVWAFAQEQGKTNPGALEEFRTRLEKRVQATSGRSLDQWLNLCSKTQQSLDRWSTIIRENWKCEVMEILPNQYATDKSLSLNMLKGLARLSTLKSLDVGRKLLQEAIDNRKMPAKNGGRNFYGRHLTYQDVTKAVEKAGEIQGNAQTLADQSSTTPRSNKRKRDALPTPSPSAAYGASGSLTEELLGSTSVQTPDITQQDLRNKASGADSGWFHKMWFRKDHQMDIPSLVPRNEMLDQHPIGHPSASANVVQETDVLKIGSTVHQITPVSHQQEDDTTYEDLVSHQDGSNTYKRVKLQEPFSIEVHDCQIMSPEQVRDNTMPSLPDFDSSLGSPSDQDNDNEVEATSMGSPSSHMQMAVPTSDLKGAKSSLRSGKWLSSTAIQLALEHCYTAGVRVFDPSFLSPASRKRLNPLSPEDTTLLFPVNINGNHWALIVVDTEKVTAEFWNSLPDPKYQIEAQNAINDLGRCLHGGSENELALTKWTLTSRPCARQDNSSDCGIYTIVFAMYRILNLPIPQSIDPHLWRQVLCVLLDENAELTLNDQERHSTEGPSPDTTKGIVRASDVKDVLRQNNALILQSLHRSQRDVTSIKGIMDLSKIFQERQTSLYEEYREKLHEVTEKATFYKRMSNSLDEMDLSDDDSTHLARTQTLVHKYEKTKQPKIQSELSRIEKVVQGWARVMKTCGKEYEGRKSRVDEAKDEIQRTIQEQVALGEVVRQLQDELTSSIS